MYPPESKSEWKDKEHKAESTDSSVSAERRVVKNLREEYPHTMSLARLFDCSATASELSAELGAMKADNAALLESIHAFHEAWKSGRDTLALAAMLRRAKDPHPGSALLEEVKALREWVKELEGERDAADSARALMADRLREAERNTAFHEARSKERNEFAARLARYENSVKGDCVKANEELSARLKTARAEALEEAARRAEWASVMDVPPNVPTVGLGADPASARNIAKHIRALKAT